MEIKLPCFRNVRVSEPILRVRLNIAENVWIRCTSTLLLLYLHLPFCVQFYLFSNDEREDCIRFSICLTHLLHLYLFHTIFLMISLYSAPFEWKCLIHFLSITAIFLADLPKIFITLNRLKEAVRTRSGVEASKQPQITVTYETNS